MIDESSTLGELPRLSLRAGVFEWLELRLMAPNAVGVFDGSGAALAEQRRKLDFLMNEMGVREEDLVSASYEGLCGE